MIGGESAVLVGDIAAGQEHAAKFGCSACHSADGNPSVGPTWQGLAGTERVLADGSVVLADDEYLRESILEPNAKVVQGFSPGIMPPNFGEQLDDQQLADLVAYIESLG